MITKKDISILIGNSLDRFDTALTGFLAPILAPVFFPQHDPVVQLIFAYSISALCGFFSRPIGAYFFGAVARRYGPLFGLSYSLIGVAITTVCIGCIPSYATIGCIAPLSLIVVRMVRGICASGESTIAKLYIMEGKSDQDALTASYFYQSSSMLGTILASGAATLVIASSNQLAWRICFWLGGVTGIVGYYLRCASMHGVERTMSNQFVDYQLSNGALLWRNKSIIIRIALISSFSYVTYAIPFVFMNNFVPLITTISLKTMMALNTLLLIFDMVLIPLCGRVTKLYDATNIMMFAGTILTVSIIPLFYGLTDAFLPYVTFVRIWIVFWGIVFMCPLHFWLRKLCNSSDQYFLIGMGGTLAAATLGHITTPVCLYLWHVSGFVVLPAVYIMLVMFIAVYAIKTASIKEEIKQIGFTAAGTEIVQDAKVYSHAKSNDVQKELIE